MVNPKVGARVLLYTTNTPLSSWVAQGLFVVLKKQH
ncbi:hypothetical protein JOC54_002637 [Alkalihalobacillus xiaoxiensis]|uniref:Uncharacterized protein n=1 Tax=Shouchella xiaoxiensis TaxID=766895 RepID=A0ABS2SV19_9BACI|nr:hypothetical protein [Shouchella xiaoxiensis]